MMTRAKIMMTLERLLSLIPANLGSVLFYRKGDEQLELAMSSSGKITSINYAKLLFLLLIKRLSALNYLRIKRQ